MWAGVSSSENSDANTDICLTLLISTQGDDGNMMITKPLFWLADFLFLFSSLAQILKYY